MNIKVKKIKVLVIIMISFIVLCTCKSTLLAIESNNSVENVDIYGYADTKSVDGTYRFSEDNSDIYLPFIRYVQDRAIVDKNVSKSGIIFAGGNLDVNQNMSGVQFLISGDTVRLNSDMEYTAIFANNVIIDTNISKSILIFANNVTITEKGSINEDLILFADQLDMLGTVKGSVIGSIERLNVLGTIDKDLRAKVYNIKLYNDSHINGQIYINTVNKLLDISDKYPDAKVQVIEDSNKTQNVIMDIVFKGILYSILFAVLYLIIDAITNKKLFVKFLNKVNNDKPLIVFGGIINLIIIPFVIVFLILLAIAGTYIVTIPILIAYISLITIVIILSNFVVGSTFYKYIEGKHLDGSNKSIKFLTLFITYLVIYYISNIPYINTYVKMSVVIFAVGIVFASIIKTKNKNNLDNNLNNIDDNNKNDEIQNDSKSDSKND